MTNAPFAPEVEDGKPAGEDQGATARRRGLRGEQEAAPSRTREGASVTLCFLGGRAAEEVSPQPAGGLAAPRRDGDRPRRRLEQVIDTGVDPGVGDLDRRCVPEGGAAILHGAPVVLLS